LSGSVGRGGEHLRFGLYWGAWRREQDVPVRRLRRRRRRRSSSSSALLILWDGCSVGCECVSHVTLVLPGGSLLLGAGVQQLMRHASRMTAAALGQSRSSARGAQRLMLRAHAKT